MRVLAFCGGDSLAGASEWETVNGAYVVELVVHCDRCAEVSFQSLWETTNGSGHSGPCRDLRRLSAAASVGIVVVSLWGWER